MECLGGMGFFDRFDGSGTPSPVLCVDFNGSAGTAFLMYALHLEWVGFIG